MRESLDPQLLANLGNRADGAMMGQVDYLLAAMENDLAGRNLFRLVSRVADLRIAHRGPSWPMRGHVMEETRGNAENRRHCRTVDDGAL